MNAATDNCGSSSPGIGGVRVVEFGTSGIAAAYAAWLLALMGAEVTRLVGFENLGVASDPLSLCLELLAQHKHTARMPASLGEIASVLTDCDILVCDQPAALESIGLSIDTLRERFPRLVLGFASTFGLSGPYSQYPGVGLDAQALSGVAWALGESGREPLSLPVGIAEHQSGAFLAAGCLMGLSARDACGKGTVVDVALAEVLASYVGGNCRFYIHHGMQWQRSGRRASASGGAYPYVILPCKDGEVCICGRTREEWNRLVQVMGNPDWAAEPRYQDLRAMGRRYPEEVDALLLPWLAQHTMAQLEELAIKNNLIVSPIREFAEIVATPHFRSRGFLKPACIAGRDVLAPSLPFRVLEARDPAAPDLAATLLRSAAPPGAPAVTPTKPLAGLRVLDFGWVWSAPWVGTILGELGAQVLKVEHSLRPDNTRLSGKIIRDGEIVKGPSTEMSPMFHQINHGKLGITLNVKEPRAVELLKRLVTMSDLVIENMSPGAMDRTHLGYDELREINPRIVVLSMSAAGQFGELSDMRAYAPTMSSFVGMEALVGYSGEAPIGALNVGLADPSASAHALVAVLAALRRARATGRGCYIDLSQIEALLDTLSPYLLEAQVRGEQTAPRGSRHPRMAPHGIYPALGADQWLSIAVADDAQWARLAALAAGQLWAAEPRYRTVAGRLADRTRLDAELAAWTVLHSRDELTGRLRSLGIASSPVLPVEEMWKDPHFAARGVKSPIEIPVYGSEDVFRAPWRFADFEPVIDGSGPLLGQHNQWVFGELLGLPADEIDELIASGVIR
jgi:crotonobetainyl-CoA:carnitine CoA-transferase CaiB-like acyl-CoA transferase